MKICGALNCRIEDIMEVVPDEKGTLRNRRIRSCRGAVNENYRDHRKEKAIS